MTDVVSPEKRSQMMSGIKSKNTQPEIVLRKYLHNAGFRFRINVKDLPGKPDMVFRKYNSIIFIHGCFWHGHDCKLFKWPKTRPEFWKKKIESNISNDEKVLQTLQLTGWRVCIVWECSVKGKGKDIMPVTKKISSWLKGNKHFLEIRG
jgi:DNA mismatch endonuclease (patch repair protein)